LRDLPIWDYEPRIKPLPEWIAGWEADLKWDVNAPKKKSVSFAVICDYISA